MKLGPRRNYHEGRAALRHYANQPVSYDLYVGFPILHLLTVITNLRVDLSFKLYAAVTMSDVRCH